MYQEFRATIKGGIVDDNGTWDDDRQMIRIGGCACCTETKPLTEALLQRAIKDAEAWLEELRGLVGTLPE